MMLTSGDMPWMVAVNSWLPEQKEPMPPSSAPLVIVTGTSTKEKWWTLKTAPPFPQLLLHLPND
ncbi:hypothetical protein Sjap_012084 [Stephania japonica]|uniref:Uncharacterized protein n=1 Tax=Stephania japonica TaxID=461633 RepID=A0AAP0NWF7_9MAGN